MKKRLIAFFCVIGMLCGTASYAENMEEEECPGFEIVPEFEIILDGEPMEEIMQEDILAEDEEARQTGVSENEEEALEEKYGEQEALEDIAEEDDEQTVDNMIEEGEESGDTETPEYVFEEVAEPFFYANELLAEVYDVSVDVNTVNKVVEICIDGAGLTNRLASIKISPLGGYGEIYYIRTVKLEGDMFFVTAELPEAATGLCSVDVDIAELGHWHKVAVIGESENLTCVSNRKIATISGSSKTAGIKSVQIKVLDEDGEIVFLKQKNSNADGSFELNVELPNESSKYMVWITVNGEVGGYAKTIVPFNPTEAKYTYNFTAYAVSGAYVDAAIYAKNIPAKKRYVYELDYSASANALTLADACALSNEKALSPGICENTDVEILSIRDGKIRFVVNGDTEENKRWSGTLNLIRFKSEIGGNVSFTLRIFE